MLGALIRDLRLTRGWSQDDLADALRLASDRDTVTREDISRWERGKVTPGRLWLPHLAGALEVPLAELQRAKVAPRAVTIEPGGDDELEAHELARRVAASDVGSETVSRLELVVDDLCVAYPGTPPSDLLFPVQRHLAYVSRLLDVRKTLAEHRRLLVVGGWLSLLAATCHIDLRTWPAATARLRTAADLAEQTGHSELAGWCLETRAWQVLTTGDYRSAVVFAQGAQETAPQGSSAFIQATAQEGRAWSRLGMRDETHDALTRVERLVAPLPVPARPEHHYRYDPTKSDAYIATTLSWLGDPAAEPYARQVLAHLETTAGGPPRPRRAASARLDLALALLAADKPDEAGHTAMTALLSGRLVPSNYWRAAEVITAVEAHRVPEATELREAYQVITAESAAQKP